jgi:hypothetical protein
MATYRVQIGFALDSALPKDVVTINPHFNGDNPGALADAIKTNLLAVLAIGTTVPFRIKVYDALKAPPSYPLTEVSSGTGFYTTSKPREVALCLSYYSTFNRKSYRGRLFIPAAFITGGLDLRPSPAQMTQVLQFKKVFRDNLPAQHNWVVWSPKLHQSNGVSHVWVDDEWDTQRSRGLKGVTRQVETLAA